MALHWGNSRPSMKLCQFHNEIAAHELLQENLLLYWKCLLLGISSFPKARYFYNILYFPSTPQHAMLQPCKDMMVIFSRRLPVRVWEQFLILELRLYTMQMFIAPISQSWPQFKFPPGNPSKISRTRRRHIHFLIRRKYFNICLIWFRKKGLKRKPTEGNKKKPWLLTNVST